jgi:hypothetical protein
VPIRGPDPLWRARGIDAAGRSAPLSDKDQSREVDMPATTRAPRVARSGALAAILFLPLVTHAAADPRAQTATQPASTYTYRGTIHRVDPKTGALELITGVGMALRLVHMTAPPAARAAGGTALGPAALKAGDVVRVDCHQTPAGLVADRIERVVVPRP